MTDRNQLPQTLGLFTLTAIGIGATVGTGIFFVLTETVPKAGPAVILSFLVAGLTAGLTALCYAEMASAAPGSGSSYGFVRTAFGDRLAFGVAACMSLEYGLAGSATAVGWSGYLNNFLENTLQWSIPEAWRSPMFVSGPQGLEIHAGHINLPPVLLVGLCALLLLHGSRQSAVTNAVMVTIKLAVLAFFCVVALQAFQPANFHPFMPAAGMAGVTAAAGTVFFSYVGLDTIATAGAEVHEPRRNLPLGILLALGVVTLTYLAVVVAALGAQPVAAFEGQEAGLAVILANVTGQRWPAIVLSAGAVVSVFSVTLMIVYGQTRILHTMSRDRLLPGFLQQLSAGRRVPVANIVLVSLAIAVVAALVDPGYLWDSVSLGTLVAFIAVSVCVPVMRHRARRAGHAPARGAFRLPFGPYVIPVLSVLACLYVMSGLPAVTYQTFAAWMLLAYAAYAAYQASRRRRHRS